ncbi:MAG: CBS domain-containing protein [Leptospirales bacterium]|nr:CBS domain-containing protein [Leptospirales bacterium]
MSGKHAIQVEEIMTRGIFTANLDQTWKDVARKMSAKQIHHLVIVDKDHRPVSVLSTFDFLRFAGGEAPNPEKTLAETINSPKLFSIRQEATLADVVNELNNHHVDCLVVESAENKVVGIVTPRDVMNVLFRDDV